MSLFTINVYQTVENDQVLKELKSIIKLLHNMPTLAEWKATVTEITGSIENLAGDIKKLRCLRNYAL